VSEASHPDRDPADIRLMQELVRDAWRLEGPLVVRHIGDVAWGRYHIAGREDEWRIRIWEEDGAVVAWAWLFLPATLDFQLHPRRRELLGPLFDWFENEIADTVEPTTSALVDDVETVSALRRRGYRRAAPDEPFFVHLKLGLADVGAPAVPDGYVVRHIRGEEDLERRVAVHRAAWAPSRVTTASHRDLMSAWPYRQELDCVVEAPDGSFAAYCLAWLDEATGVGELEPVGTDPRFARQGLAAAACTFALGQLRRLGAHTSVVYARGDAAYRGPLRLYESLGFRRYTESVTFRRTR
jgi:ribosomal protein S18 acetylase RimI-like enzyme